jgi:hypothetical protein
MNDGRRGSGSRYALALWPGESRSNDAHVSGFTILLVHLIPVFVE